MVKKFLGLLAGAMLLLGLGGASAQVYLNADSTWVFTGNASLTFNQVALKNWVAGGENTYGGEASALLNLTYTKGAQLWKNTLDLGYGLMQYGEEGIRKNLDKLDFSSQYGYKAANHWYYSAMYTMKTQFSPGYKYPDRDHKISDIASPLYNMFSLGMDYKPDTHLSVLMSPLTGRQTYVRSDYLSSLGAFGVEKGEHSLWELGAYIKASYTNTYFNSMLGVFTKLELFSNYLNKPENIDVNYDLALDFKINSFLTARAQITLIYDDDQKITQDDGSQVAKLQIRQMFGMGLAYRF